MEIIAIDDEPLALISLINAVEEAIPDSEIYSFLKTNELLDFAKDHSCDIAFLDIQMRTMNGIELAKRLKDMMPNVNIIFVTGFSEYAFDAIKLRASGYLMKPVTAEQIKKELQNLRNSVKRKSNHRIRVQCFGNFEVFCDDVPVRFERSKSKEIFAFLVDKQGTMATTAEIAAIFWEDGMFDRARQKQMQTFICDLQKSLSALGEDGIIIKNKQGVMVDKTKFDCDLYGLLDGDVSEINTYKGQYMYSYSWAEFTTAFLDMRLIND